METFWQLASLPPLALWVASPVLAIATTLLLTRLITTWNYHRSLRQFKTTGAVVIRPPQIPYNIPWLGNALAFSMTAGETFWPQLFSWYPRSTGVMTLLLGGKTTHILFSNIGVQALFRSSIATREIHERELYDFVFTMPPDQAQITSETKSHDFELNGKYLTNYDRVNELTARFADVLSEELSKDMESVLALDKIGVYEWLRDRMFAASCIALFGDTILQYYPTFGDDFWGFDGDFIKFLFQVPAFIMKDAIVRRERIFDKLEAWATAMHKLTGGAPIDPEGPAWEPLFGSRLNRARQIDYKARGLTPRSSAALDLGIAFGLSSNVIPSTAWMLLHVISPKAPSSLLPRVMAEVEKSTKADGSLDIAILITRPILQSLWTETLRLHLDVLVTRHLPQDLVLPLDEHRRVSFRKGDHVFAGSWLGHHDSDAWPTENAPIHEFDAERFVTRNQSGEEVYSMGKTGMAGRFFPFGGGKTLCPGRFFAKQEAIGALAMILLRFDFEFKGYVDIDKKPTTEFPRPKPMIPGTGAQSPGGDMMVKIHRR